MAGQPPPARSAVGRGTCIAAGSAPRRCRRPAPCVRAAGTAGPRVAARTGAAAARVGGGPADDSARQPDPRGGAAAAAIAAALADRLVLPVLCRALLCGDHAGPDAHAGWLRVFIRHLSRVGSARLNATGDFLRRRFRPDARGERGSRTGASRRHIGSGEPDGRRRGGGGRGTARAGPAVVTGRLASGGDRGAGRIAAIGNPGSGGRVRASFPSDQVKLGFGISSDRRARRQLAHEIRAQFAAFAATGLTLDHANAHKHMHLHPTVGRLMIGIGREFGLRSIRIPAEPPATLARAGTRVGIGDRALYAWTRLLRHQARAAGMMTNDHCFGLAWSGHMTRERVRRLLDELPDGVSRNLFPSSDGTRCRADPVDAGLRTRGGTGDVAGSRIAGVTSADYDQRPTPRQPLTKRRNGRGPAIDRDLPRLSGKAVAAVLILGAARFAPRSPDRQTGGTTRRLI